MMSFDGNITMKWINVKDIMPPDYTAILVHDLQFGVVPAILNDRNKFIPTDEFIIECKEVTHWMEFPPKPEQLIKITKITCGKLEDIV